MILQISQLLHQLLMLLRARSSLVIVLLEDLVLMRQLGYLLTQLAILLLILSSIVRSLPVDLVLVALFERLSLSVMHIQQLAQIVQ